ncbi:hypothetical protein D3C72_2394350 [compost metagenome]
MSGVAVRATVVPVLNEAEQVEPQEMPAGDETTEPEPPRVTVSAAVVGVTGMAVNVAETDAAALTVTAHAPVPEQAPDQPVKL